MTAVEPRSTEEASRAAHIINWILALATIPGAIAVVTFLYMQIMGTAGCAHQRCPRAGRGGLGFVIIR